MMPFYFCMAEVSAMVALVYGYTNTACLMIGEKAAEMVLQDAA